MEIESYIKDSNGTLTFAGADAVHLYQAIALKHGLMLLKKGIKPNSGWTRNRAMNMAAKFTGQTYGSGNAEIDRAVHNLDVWITTMRAALPVKE